jgi:hypothetical protein
MPENRTTTTPGQLPSRTLRLLSMWVGSRGNWPGVFLCPLVRDRAHAFRHTYSHNKILIRLRNQCLPALTPISHRSEDGQTYMYAAVSVQDSAHFPAPQEKA